MSLHKTYKIDEPKIVFYTSEEFAQATLNRTVFVITTALKGDKIWYDRNYLVYNRCKIWQCNIED